ncbi:unnamed protein product [Lymnaea stagnalis]|uniref:Uncharacterized protein n=1 Tax=Lymnaea stagnalis TaxID=6523 RepID=A0AAV2IFR3_LYMST
MTQPVKYEASDSHLLSCPSENKPEDNAKQNESKAHANHYVSDDGLLYVTIGDIEKQTTRTSAGSVKSKREKVQYQEIDFTKTGQITIAEIENTEHVTSL